MGVLEGLALYGFLAVLVERLTEAVFGLPFDKIKGAQEYKWALVYLGLATGVFVAWTGSLDLVAELTKVELGDLGVVLTGLSIGGGANLLHQVWPGAPKVQKG